MAEDIQAFYRNFLSRFSFGPPNADTMRARAHARVYLEVSGKSRCTLRGTEKSLASPPRFFTLRESRLARLALENHSFKDLHRLNKTKPG